MGRVKQRDRGSLLSSAKEFLIESLRDFARDKLNFAIVHVVTATELVLKERLFRENRALILRNIDSDRPHRELTVQLSRLPRRLQNMGMPLDPPVALKIRINPC
jgi:HEPN domain-containing protein